MSSSVPSPLTTHTPPTVGGSATLADGDYGDIVVSGSGTVLSIDSSVITTYARSFLDDANEAAFKATTNLEAGTDYPSLATFNSHETRHRSGGGDALSVLNLAGFPGGTTDYLRSDASFHDLSTAAEGALWTTTVKKTADEDVTNSTTLQDDDELQIAVGAGETWLFELLVAYSAAGTAIDYKWAGAISAGTMVGWVHVEGIGNADAAFEQLTRFNVGVTDTSGTGISFGTGATHSVERGFRIMMMFTFSNAGTFKSQFAQNTIDAANAVRTYTGSTLRGRKFA